MPVVSCQADAGQDSGPSVAPRRTIYGDEDRHALLMLSDLFDGICSRRLRAAMDVELPGLVQSGALQVSPACYQRLLRISPATIDRLLSGRRPQVRSSRGFTKPGTLLKHQIAVRTWAQWTEDHPGFCEMDLVDHSGGQIIRGADHAWTLCFTDVHTAWTECVAVRNKAQIHVFEAIRCARARLPFPLLGIDSDNGSELINDQLRRYCGRERGDAMTMPMSSRRTGRSSDAQLATTARTPPNSWICSTAYALLHDYTNSFLPVAKLHSKTRDGSRVTRTYDKPQTPYARVLASPHVSEEHKAALRETHAVLCVVDLRQQINQLQAEIIRLVSNP